MNNICTFQKEIYTFSLTEYDLRFLQPLLLSMDSKFRQRLQEHRDMFQKKKGKKIHSFLTQNSRSKSVKKTKKKN